MRRLPPLGALRAFEAAARHRSFSRAADELHVTHSAVSHQIRALEESLELDLFRRTGRGVALTEHGRSLLPVVSDAFDRIAEAVERLAPGGTAPLTISVEPSFAARWLVLRLGRFRAVHPEIDLRLIPSSSLVDFGRDDVDVAVRYGRGGWPDLHAEWLIGGAVFPVCSPALLHGDTALRVPADLRHHTLLHEETTDGWRDWLAAAGIRGVDPSRGPRFEEATLALQAAAAGQGVALADDVLAVIDLAEGRLVRPFGVEVPHEAGYWLVYPPAYARRSKVAAFRSWLMEEVAADRRL